MSSSSQPSFRNRSLLALGLLPLFPLLGLTGCADATSPLDRSDSEDQKTHGASQALLPNPVCVTFRRGASGAFEDAQIQANASPLYPTGQFGAFRTMSIGSGNFGPREALLRPLPGNLPPMVQLLSATLRLPVVSSTPATIRASRVIAPWNESDVKWSTFYANPTPQAEPEAIFGTTTTNGTTLVSLDVTDIAWDIGSGLFPNNGILLRQSSPAYTTLHTSEAIDPENRPALELCYIPDLCAGVVCKAKDSCHEVGACEPSTGQCEAPTKPDGTACDDGTSATQGDVCNAGVCLGSAPGAYVYELFAGGSGFACPTGATAWVSAVPRDALDSSHAHAACEACYGTGACYLSDEDGAGLAWGPISPNQPTCGSAYFGFTEGATGDEGRAFEMCASTKTFGHWGK